MSAGVATDGALTTPDNPGGARQRDGREFGTKMEHRRAARVNTSNRARYQTRDSSVVGIVANPCDYWG